MTQTLRTLHVVWGESRAGSVREALRLSGLEAPVVALPQELNLGPIDPLDLTARRAWFEANTRSDDDPREDRDDPERPWAEATAADVRPVFWVCLTDAAEHASLLAFATRMAGRPFDLVDATGLHVTTAAGISPVRSLGQLRPEEIVASALLTRRRPFSRAESEAAVAAWSRLRDENAPVRVVREGRLVSAPLTHFDAVLAKQAGRDPEMVVQLIGRTLHHLCDEVDPLGQGCSGELLFTRVLALGEAGVLDVTGAGPGMRDYRVRRPDA